MRTSRTIFDIPTLLITIGAGLLWGLIGNLLYRSLLDKMWTPLLVVLYFLGLFITIGFAIIVSSLIRTNESYNSASWVAGLIFLAALIVGSFIFEILYEIGAQKYINPDPTAYIFLIDDSGSMETNDPQNQRVDAISSAMSATEPLMPFCVYKFTNSAYNICPLTTANKASSLDIEFASSGGTNIVGSLRSVLSDIKGGRLVAGTSPKIILLSDGQSNRGTIKSVIRDAVKQNVSVSTIGLGAGANASLLEEIAVGTNGVYLSIDEISQLSTALQTAGSQHNNMKRNLLNYRYFPAGADVIYCLMRIVFLSLLCGVIVFLRSIFFCVKEPFNSILYWGLLAAFLSALIMEFGINYFLWNEKYIRIVMCVLIAVIASTKEVFSYASQNTQSSEDAFASHTQDKQAPDNNALSEGQKERDLSKNQLKY